MARGLKKHLKRLNAPSHWMLDKLGGAFVSSFRFIPSIPRLDCQDPPPPLKLGHMSANCH
jgi:hypothetical protein